MIYSKINTDEHQKALTHPQKRAIQYRKQCSFRYPFVLNGANLLYLPDYAYQHGHRYQKTTQYSYTTCRG